MKQSQRLDQLIQQLSDGEFHSGQSLGEQLSISRAAVNQHIHKLEELALSYSLSAVKVTNCLNSWNCSIKKKIKQATEHFTNEPDFAVYSVVDSSNDELKLLAQEQASGRWVFGIC